MERNNQLISLLIVAFLFCFLKCGSIGILFCKKCISQAAEFELIDEITSQRIINPIIIVKRPDQTTDTTSNNYTKEIDKLYMVHDSVLTIYGEPGKYSFEIQTEEYRTFKLEGINVQSDGNPMCHFASPEYFKINLVRKSIKSSKSDGILIQQHTRHCCE